MTTDQFARLAIQGGAIGFVGWLWAWLRSNPQSRRHRVGARVLAIAVAMIWVASLVLAVTAGM